MKLLFDIGNTRTKVFVSTTVGDIVPCQNWRPLLSKAESVLVSNVAAPEDLPAEVAQHPGCRILSWQSPEVGAWLKNVPEQLGADRVAADIGALSLQPGHTLLVIDAGTCLTFDVISREGHILGGAISPGAALRLKAMHEHTAALPLPDISGDHPVLGYDTPSSMRSGALNGMKWEMEGYIEHIRGIYPDLRVFVTGGDTIDFAPHLQSIITRESCLIGHGLLAVFAPRETAGE